MNQTTQTVNNPAVECKTCSYWRHGNFVKLAITCDDCKTKEYYKIQTHECVEGWKEFFNSDEIECDDR